MITEEQMIEILNELSIKKDEKPYLSEAQFQFELAWELQKEKEKFNINKILLEYTACSEKLDDGKRKRFESDIIVIFNDKNYIAIELKYKTAKAEVNGIKLIPQAGQPGTKYDYLWDIHRIELLHKKDTSNYEYHLAGKCIGGYAIFLTNDGSYWKKPKDTDTAYNFRLCNKITPSDKLTWNVPNGQQKSWMNSRKQFYLLNSHDLKWSEKYITYKVLTKSGKKKTKEFKYLLTAIGKCNN